MSQKDIIAPNEAPFGAEAGAAAALREKFIDILTAGYDTEFDPDEAEQAGAFAEDALSVEDAAESSLDAIDPRTPVSGATELS